MVDPPHRTDVRARLDALPDAVPPAAPEPDDGTAAILVWCVLAGAVYVLGAIVVILIRLVW